MDQGSNHSNEIKLNTGTRLNNRFVLGSWFMKNVLEILVLGLTLIKPAFGAGKKVDQKKPAKYKK